MRLATGAGGYWLRLALFLSDSRSDDQPLPIAHTIARKLLAKLRRGHIDRIFKAVSAGRAGPHVSNAISGEMFRPFRCDDIATALHALIQRYSTHETFPLLVAIFAAWIVPQCGAVMAGERSSSGTWLRLQSSFLPRANSQSIDDQSPKSDNPRRGQDRPNCRVKP